MRAAIVVPLLLAVGVVACQDPADPGALEQPSFTAHVSGDMEGDFTGAARLDRTIPDGLAETDPSGTTTARDVTPIVLAAHRTSPAQIYLGVVDAPLHVGEYRLHRTGTPVGQTPEFYGSFITPPSGGTYRSFPFVEGAVTITSVMPRVEGRFQARASGSYRCPLTGGTCEPTTGALAVEGVFVVVATALPGR